MNTSGILNMIVPLFLAPLLPGIINKTKAFFAGRQGPSIFQLYFDIVKLFNKGAVYSKTTSWVFRAVPLVSFSSSITVLMLLPFGSMPSLISFPCDLIVAVYFLGLMRFFLVIGALDTGSSFEGMGASREVQFSALSEPALLLCLAAISKISRSMSLSGMFSPVSGYWWNTHAPVLIMISLSLLIVFLAENSRIPVDDPNTHLELTMIHEVIILDNGGPDLGLILYGSVLKMWILGLLVIYVVIPMRTGNILLDLTAIMAGMGMLSVIVGAIESVMARLRMKNVSQLLIGSQVMSALALIFLLLDS